MRGQQPIKLFANECQGISHPLLAGHKNDLPCTLCGEARPSCENPNGHVVDRDVVIVIWQAFSKSIPADGERVCEREGEKSHDPFLRLGHPFSLFLPSWDSLFFPGKIFHLDGIIIFLLFCSRKSNSFGLWLEFTRKRL